MVQFPFPAALVLLILDFPLLSIAYSWNFDAAPQQCKNLSITITGSGGQPPYRVLIIPSGSSPFSNNTEVRRIMDTEFSGNSTSISFQLNYPADSQFVAVVSDASGFGSGGTSAAAQVSSSDDTSCYDASQSVSPKWVFNIYPESQIVQCQQTRLWWTPSNNISGTPNFFGVIPGGDSFVVPESNVNVTEISGQSTTGFGWTPSIRGGTTLHIVANDNNGNGTGGSLRTTVGDSLSNDNSCLNSTSPSSTAGSPAGGSYPTDSSGDSTGSSSTSSSGSNVGAIVGGVVGGVLGLLALLLALFFIRRRSKIQQKHNEKPVDLLQADEGDERPQRTELPQYYEPDPFIMPEPTVADSGTDAQSLVGRPISGSERPTSWTTSGTPDVASTSGATRKAGAPRQLRPVNIIQHDDAGPSEATNKEEEPETIELPPAYTNIRK